jgi:predicted enzyme related to lactoylglutathione lyase
MSVTFEVEDFEAAVRRLRDYDVAFFLGPTETKVCHWAAFRDPDENRLVIHKRK